MNRVWACILLLCAHLEGTDVSFSGVQSEETKGIITDLNSEPSSIVAGCVNVISGNFIDYEVDLTIPGPESFTFSRSYCSNDTSNSCFFRHWQCNQQGYLSLLVETFPYDTKLDISIIGSLGSRTYFQKQTMFGATDFVVPPDSNMYKSGLTNIAQGKISGQNNLRNSRCHFKCSYTAACLVTDGAGEIHEYLSRTPAEKPNFKFGKNKKYGQGCDLKSITKPSGMNFEYHYTKAYCLSHVNLKNRWNQHVSSLRATKWGEKDVFGKYIYRMEAPDGRFAQYELERWGKDKFQVLKKVTRSDGPEVSYEHEDGKYTYNEAKELKGHVERIIRKNKPEGRFTGIEYYDMGDNYIVGGRNITLDSRASPPYNRVKRILAPCGTDATPRELYCFDYCIAEGSPQWGTGVYDALGNKTDYYFNRDNRLEGILKFADSGATPYTHEQLFWWHQDTQQTYIKTRCFAPFGQENKTYAQSYFYDNAGNLTQHVILGNIRGVNIDAPLRIDEFGNITQLGPDQKVKECTYSEDGRNLLMYMKEGDLSQVFTYFPNTNLVTSCLHWDPKGIYARKFYEYDENAQVVKAISDNGCLFDASDLTGVTLRTVEYTTRSKTYPLGLPIEVKRVYWDPKTGTEKQITREINRFDLQGRMIEKEVYDAEDQFAYSQGWQYNTWGNLIQERNALGHAIQYGYDANGNKIREEGPFQGNPKTFAYDYMNRLIRIDEWHADGVLTQHFRYDLMGNKIASVDVLGQETDYTYDAFGRCFIEQGPADTNGNRPTTTYRYDELSHPVEVTDALGRTVYTDYTIFGKPYRIRYPDGSEERFEYDLDNRLVKSIAKNGTATIQQYDYQGRLTKKEMSDPQGTVLSSQVWGYDRSHLLFEIDPAGNITAYEYDAQGRKTAIVQGDNRTTIEYDSLGRAYRTTYGGVVKIVTYDVLNRIVAESEEDLEGNLLKSQSFVYDAMGRKVQTISGTGAITKCIYDSHSLPLEKIDQEGNSTHVHGDFHFVNEEGVRVFALTSTDPKGVKTTTVHNIYGKPAHITIKNSFGELLHETKYSYDLVGNRTEVIEVPCIDGIRQTPQIARMEYDTLNRMTVLIKAAESILERRTEIAYYSSGEKASTRKPDGVLLQYTYDALGRLEEYFSSDCSFHYRYQYDLNGNAIQIDDLIANKMTQRFFDAYNHMIEETLQNGLTTSFNYTPDGKLEQMTIPDGTGVQYHYHGSFLKAINRVGNTTFTHTYDAYDLDGKLLKETLADHSPVEYAYSPKGNLLKASSLHFAETDAAYDHRGNLLKRSIQDAAGHYQEYYAYDDLGQLIEEKGAALHQYKCDSLNNRIEQDGFIHQLNTLNQLTRNQTHTFTYDLCGNLILRKGEEGETHYSYDALDRLTSIKTPSGSIAYAYDAMNRCITSHQEDQEPLAFFYLDQAEIGASARGRVQQFQILGLGRKTEPCAAVAIELNQTPYAAIRDQSGHVRALATMEGKIAATYRYSAFGKFTVHGDNVANPWLLAGKRYEPLTGLVIFGRRFYDADTGRWTTEDPAGYEGGPNLYAYLSNSPLVHYDAFGLYESNLMGFGSLLGTAACNIFSGLLQSIQIFGSALQQFSWNLIPCPLIKDLPMAAGYFLSHGTLNGYTMSYREPHSRVDTLPGTIRPGVGHMSANGIGVPRHEVASFQESVQGAWGGEQIHHAYTADHGFLQNIGECLLQMAGVHTNQTAKAKEAFDLAQQDAGGVGDNNFVTADVHSRGGLTLKNMRTHLAPQEEKMLYIGTYGTAAIASRSGVAAANNYISPRDVIPAIADPFRYAKARFFGTDNVKFVPTEERCFEHSFLNDSYQKALKENVDMFNDFYHERRK